MSRTLISIGTLLIIFLVSIGPVPAQPEIELKDYQTRYPGESNVLLSKTQKIDISVQDNQLSIQTEVYEERFFLDSKASLFSEESILYSGFYDVSDIQARTLVPDKRKYKPVPVRKISEKDEFSSGVFYDDVKSKNFIYPALTEGAKTTLSYRQKTTDPHFLKGFYLAELVPIEQQEIIIKSDKNVELAFSYFNTTPEESGFSKTEAGDKVIYKWSRKNMPKLTLKESSPSHLYFIPHIIPRVTSYTVEGKKINVLSDVKDLHEWYSTLIDRVDRSRSDELVAITDSLIQNKETELEKVKAIYNWVQNNIKYIAVEDGLGGFIPRNPTAVCEKRYGDCKDMSSIIHQMLDIAEIPSHITWVGTRDIPYSYEEVPTPNVDNHMITTYIKDSTYYFLDATGQYTPIDLVSGFIQGKEVMIHHGESFELYEVPVMPAERSQILDTITIRMEDGKLTGEGNIYYTGYQKIELTERAIRLNNDNRLGYFKSYLNKGNNKFLLDKFEIQHLDNKYEPLSIHYTFNISDYAKRLGDEIYVNLHLDKMLVNAQIKEDRTQEIERDYKTRIVNVVNMEIPEGFEVAYLPENSSYQHEKFGFEMQYSKKAGRLTLETEIVMDHLLLEQEDFGAWNEMVGKLGKAYAETVLLKHE